MTSHDIKSTIVEIGKRMYNKGFVAANDGNISCKTEDGFLWITPTGVSKGYMAEDELLKLDMEGNITEGPGSPSSEVKMHLRAYAENPDIKAVVHAHPPVATSFAVAGIPLTQAILTEAIVQLGAVQIAPYATPGTEEVPDSIALFCRDRRNSAVLLANHGALCWGKSLMEAYFKMETLEYYATLIMYTENILGKSVPIPKAQADKLLAIRNGLI